MTTDDERTSPCAGCDPDNPGGHLLPPSCVDLGNGEVAVAGTAADHLAAARWLRCHYPGGVTGPRYGPVFGQVLNMGHDLYRMLRASILPGLTPGEQAVALLLADICMDETGKPPRNMNASKRVCEDLGITPGTLRNTLAKLGARGLELRVPIGEDRRGRPVYAAKGHAVDYRFPALPPRGSKGALLDAPLKPEPVDNEPETAAKGALLGAPLEPKAHPGRHLNAQRRTPGCAPTPTDLTTPSFKDDPDTALPVSQPELEGARARLGQDRFSDSGRPSPRTAEETAEEARRQADALTEWMRQHPETAAAS